LVTGGAGTIGSAVVRRLQADGAEVRIADQRGDVDVSGDLRDYATAREAVNGCDRVIHLAAIVGGIGNFHKYPFTLLENNHGLYNAIFRAAIEEEVERFVYVSSSMVFENATSFPTKEADLSATPAPWSAYGFSKLAGEVYCRAAHDEHGLRYTICRPFNAYGPGEMPENEPGIAHMVPDVIKKVLAGQRPLQIFGSGEQTRSITYVDDIADGIVTAMNSDAGLNEDFNISNSEEMTVEQIAWIIWEECGNNPDEFEVDVQRRWPDVSKAEEMLGWKAQVPVRDGIRRTVDWLRARV
jgi:nucleoside-diphosphate-sugar epimerase